MSRYYTGSLHLPSKTFSKPGLGNWYSDNPYKYSDGYNNPANIIMVNSFPNTHGYYEVLYSTKSPVISNVYWETPYYINIVSGTVINNYIPTTISLTKAIEIKGYDTNLDENNSITILPKFSVSTVVASRTNFNVTQNNLWINKLQITLYPYSSSSSYISAHLDLTGFKYSYWSERGNLHTFNNEVRPY